MNKRLNLSNVSSKYGAQMGRRNVLPTNPDAPIKLRMERLKWVDGDYDQWGAYWGHGTPLYCAWGEDEQTQVYVFVRAPDRQSAKEQVRKQLPQATFYR